MRHLFQVSSLLESLCPCPFYVDLVVKLILYFLGTNFQGSRFRLVTYFCLQSGSWEYFALLPLGWKMAPVVIFKSADRNKDSGWQLFKLRPAAIFIASSRNVYCGRQLSSSRLGLNASKFQGSFEDVSCFRECFKEVSR